MDSVPEEHLLHRNWSFWLHEKNEKQTYEQNTICLGNFETVEGFWRYLNNIPTPEQWFTTGRSKPTVGGKVLSSISVFEEGVEPKWEDPRNKNGGEISLRKFKCVTHLAEMWEQALLWMIGEMDEKSEDVVGVRIVDSSILSHNTRILYRVEIWFKTIDFEERFDEAIRSWGILGSHIQLKFKLHSSASETVPISHSRQRRHDRRRG